MGEVEKWQVITISFPCSQVGLQVAPLTHIHPAVMLTGGREAETLRVCVAGCVWFQDGSGTWVGHLTLQFCTNLIFRHICISETQNSILPILALCNTTSLIPPISIKPKLHFRNCFSQRSFLIQFKLSKCSLEQLKLS